MKGRLWNRHHHQALEYASGDKWVQEQGGWAGALGVNDELFRQLEAMSRDANDLMY
jgi:hypothetical protein